MGRRPITDTGARLRQGERLRRARQVRNYTQLEAADKIGVTRQSISDYERGRYSPGPDVLKRISEVYELPIRLFMTEELPEAYAEAEWARLIRDIPVDLPEEENVEAIFLAEWDILSDRDKRFIHGIVKATKEYLDEERRIQNFGKPIGELTPEEPA